MIKTSPNIKGEKRSEMIEYLHDARHYYNLMPYQRQITNMFFRDVSMNVKDEWWDIFEVNEYVLNLFELAYSQHIAKWIPWS